MGLDYKLVIISVLITKSEKESLFPHILTSIINTAKIIKIRL